MNQRIDTEMAVIGCCLADAKAYWKVADVLGAGDFSDGKLGQIFSEVVSRARNGDIFDAIAIGEDRPELASLAMDAQSHEGWRSAVVRAYAERVAQNAVMRRLRQAGAQISRIEGDDALAEAQKLVNACAPRNVGAVRHISEFVRQSVVDIDRRLCLEEKLTGIVTGIPALDAMTEGWQPSDLIILAARPSVGKTAFAMHCVIAAAKDNRACLVFSIEMNGKQVNDRAISSVGKVDGTHLRHPKKIDEEEWPRITMATSELNAMPIYIDESSTQTVDVICARARQQHAQTPLSLIVVDYLTMITPPRAGTTAEGVQLITRALKGLAKELAVPVMVLSQLNREGADTKPNMKHLRDSGAIEQDADVIMFLHRPMDDHRDYLELIVAKQRNGPVGDLAIAADLKYMRFSQAHQKPNGLVTQAITADFAWDELEGAGR